MTPELILFFTLLVESGMILEEHYLVSGAFFIIQGPPIILFISSLLFTLITQAS